MNIPAYQVGQVIGDLGALVDGAEESYEGTELLLAGGALDSTLIGVEIGIPANIVGGAMAAHGSSVSGVAMSKLEEKRRKPGSLGEYKGSDAKGKENNIVRDAIKKAGGPTSGEKGNDFRSMIHAELGRLKQNLSFNELVEFIKGYL